SQWQWRRGRSLRPCETAASLPPVVDEKASQSGPWCVTVASRSVADQLACQSAFTSRAAFPPTRHMALRLLYNSCMTAIQNSWRELSLCKGRLLEHRLPIWAEDFHRQ